MKKFLMTVAALSLALAAAAQPQLTKDNIEDVIKAMTLQEKATLLVGGARAAVVNGVTSGRPRRPAHPAYPPGYRRDLLLHRLPGGNPPRQLLGHRPRGGRDQGNG